MSFSLRTFRLGMKYDDVRRAWYVCHFVDSIKPTCITVQWLNTAEKMTIISKDMVGYDKQSCDAVNRNCYSLKFVV